MQKGDNVPILSVCACVWFFKTEKIASVCARGAIMSKDYVKSILNVFIRRQRRD